MSEGGSWDLWQYSLFSTTNVFFIIVSDQVDLLRKMRHTLNRLKSLYLQFLQITLQIWGQKDLIRSDSFATLTFLSRVALPCVIMIRF